MKKSFSNFVTLSITIIIVFLFCEAGMRIAIFINNNKSFKRAMQNLPTVRDGENVTLGQMIQPSKYLKIIYELRPDISVYFQSVLVKTDNQGWRAGDYSCNKEKNTIRIIGLGDSFMFGQGVGQNEMALSYLEDKLNKKFPKKKWEVINTAVPGYNTAMEVETLEKKLLVYKPDIIIIEHIGNDFDMPNFIYETDSYLDFKKSLLFGFLLHRYKLAKQKFHLFDAPLNSREPWHYENDPQIVPAEYRDMVGWQGFTKAMLKLKRLQEENRFEVIVIVTGAHLDEKVFNFCKGLGFFTIFNFHNVNDQALVSSLKNNHPTPLQNKKTAENVLHYMIKQGIIKKCL